MNGPTPRTAALREAFNKRQIDASAILDYLGSFERESAGLRVLLDLATATVELYTGNGAQSQPWAAAGCTSGPYSEPDCELVARKCRAALAKVRP